MDNETVVEVVADEVTVVEVGVPADVVLEVVTGETGLTPNQIGALIADPNSAPGEALQAAVNTHLSQSGGEPLLTLHIADLTPHPVYDDIVDLTLIFENGLI